VPVELTYVRPVGRVTVTVGFLYSGPPVVVRRGVTRTVYVPPGEAVAGGVTLTVRIGAMVTVTDGVAVAAVALSAASLRVTATLWLPRLVEVDVVTGTTTGASAPGPAAAVAEVQTSVVVAVDRLQVHPVCDVGAEKVSCVGAVAVSVRAWCVAAASTLGVTVSV
jgi:hypothetical protein